MQACKPLSIPRFCLMKDFVGWELEAVNGLVGLGCVEWRIVYVCVKLQSCTVPRP